jgi:hypothetical protein
MGYYFHITRRKLYCDEEGPLISIEEWKSLVEADPELSFRDERDPLTAIWSGISKWPDPWFSYSERYGYIDTKNPDTPIIAKMLQMAKLLNAKVQGDDGETYITPTEHYDEDDGAPTQNVYRPWWKRLLGLK